MKRLPKKSLRLKLIYMCIRLLENSQSLPNSAGIMTSQDTKIWVISYMTYITFFPAQRFIRREAHKTFCPKANRDDSACVKQPECESDCSKFVK